MNRRAIAFLSVSLYLSAAATVAAASKPDPALVDTLDHTFQSRFETIDGKIFGAERATRTPEHSKIRRFLEQTPSDHRLVGQLESSGFDVAFFVAGREALYSAERLYKDPKWAEKIEEKVKAGGGIDVWDGVSDGVHLTSATEWAWGLRNRLGSRVPAAFTAFTRKKRTYDFRLGTMSVISRPIPASKRQCLNCHRSRDGKKRLKLGDTLGVGFYVFRPKGSKE